ncbi:hypothetical protein RhiJN_20840 [Ceratobasidium sp. AG-Ba]|nr:hypothetical protein RhiJN_20840 [Ceratobasidium sp. AG-Ba]
MTKCAPFDYPGLQDAIREYYSDGLNDKDALAMVLKRVIDTSRFRLRQVLYPIMISCLLTWRCAFTSSGHTVETATPLLRAARAQHRTAGIQGLKNIIRSESNGGIIRIPRSVITGFVHREEPEAVSARKGKAAQPRGVFKCPGSSYLWAIDQHDKWQRFYLWLHIGVDTYSSYILWMKVWWTNSNPRLIASYYLDAAEDLGGVPRLTESDPGSENFGVANSQSTLRQMVDPTLTGTMQHHWARGNGHMNIKPEIAWSVWRRYGAPSYEDLLQQGIDNGWYDSSVNIHMLIFRWVFMPLVQAYLDSYRDRMNTSYKRSNTKTVLPHGRPKYIFAEGENFLVNVPTEAFRTVREQYANPTDPVFEFVPPRFLLHITAFHHQLGFPIITRENGWACYCDILRLFENWAAPDPLVDEELANAGQLQARLCAESEQGASRGDSWGYGTELLAPVEFAFEDHGVPEDSQDRTANGSENRDIVVFFDSDEEQEWDL